VNLAFLDHLEPVFDGPEKDVRARQRVEYVVGNETGFLKRLEAFQRISLPQLWVPGAVSELQNLCEEFRFTNTATTQFDVAAGT
jgi:hypothetical protein